MDEAMASAAIGFSGMNGANEESNQREGETQGENESVGVVELQRRSHEHLGKAIG